MNDYYHQKIIEDKEYKTIKDIIDSKILSIQKTIPEWVLIIKYKERR